MLIGASWCEPQNCSCGDTSVEPTRSARNSEFPMTGERVRPCPLGPATAGALTVDSVSGGLLKTKHRQDREQDAWPEELSEGQHLGALSKHGISAWTNGRALGFLRVWKAAPRPG